MKKLLLILVCLFYSSDCYSNNKWKFLSVAEYSTYFFDSSNISPHHSIENTFNVDLLENYEAKSIQSKSSVTTFSINCNKHKVLLVYGIWYSEKMGKGTILSKGYAEGKYKDKWVTPPQDSNLNVLIKEVCG